MSSKSRPTPLADALASYLQKRGLVKRMQQAGIVEEWAALVGPQIAAVIAAAISVVLDRPYRLVSVQQVTVPVVPHLNVWAVEGRTQIFMSHKVR